MVKKIADKKIEIGRKNTLLGVLFGKKLRFKKVQTREKELKVFCLLLLHSCNFLKSVYSIIRKKYTPQNKVYKEKCRREGMSCGNFIFYGLTASFQLFAETA